MAISPATFLGETTWPTTSRSSHLSQSARHVIKPSWNAALGPPHSEEAQAAIRRGHMEENEDTTDDSPNLTAK